MLRIPTVADTVEEQSYRIPTVDAEQSSCSSLVTYQDFRMR